MSSSCMEDDRRRCLAAAREKRCIAPSWRVPSRARRPGIAQGPGGPAEVVPGQHHVRMNMYIAQAKNGKFEIVKNLGVIDPKECVQGMK